MTDQTLEVSRLAGHDSAESLILASRLWDPDRVASLHFSRLRTVFPNGAVPFAATLDYLREQGRPFEIVGMHPNQQRTHISSPMTIDQFVRWETPLTNVVWKYRDESEAGKISTKFMEALTDQVACEAGVIDALNWCIYEVLDNVFQHSHASSGYVMMQLHANQRHCVLAVTDTGRGIHRSMLEAADSSRVDHSQLSEAHLAIGHALQQGVTSKGNLNQGNGLHGLRRAVAINGGRLTVRSGRGQWSYSEGEVESDSIRNRPVLNTELHHSTTVDWQLDCAQPVSINDALGRAEQPSGLLETIEVGLGHYRIDAGDLEEYVGSRAKGEEVRTRIKNYLATGAQQVVLDLANVGVVSSSFADEVVGKLAVELGELEYRRRVFMDNASPTNRGLIERAIELRMSTGL